MSIMEWLWMLGLAVITVVFLFYRGKSSSARLAIPRVLTIFFGSQGHKTEQWANELCEFAALQGVKCVAKELNCASLAAMEKGGVAVILCSTQGKGDPPENAAKFFKRLELAAAVPSQRLSAFRYSLFGFGNSDYYNTYNRAGITMQGKLSIGN